jgi:hypothetical protein
MQSAKCKSQNEERSELHRVSLDCRPFILTFAFYILHFAFNFSPICPLPTALLSPAPQPAARSSAVA